MNLLEWVAKEIKAILPRIEEEAPPPNTWGEKFLEHDGEGNLGCSISVTNLALNKPYIVLNFLKTGNEKRKLILRIPLLVGGSEERLLTEGGKDMTRLLRKVQVKKQREKKAPFIFNPIYIHPKLSSKDIEAQIALRLLQVDEPNFYGLLEEYFKRNFQGARKIDDMSAFIVYLRDHWHLPEDWKGWRLYVGKTIKLFYSRSQGREIKLFPLEDAGKERDRIEEISEEDYKESYGIEQFDAEDRGNEIKKVMNEDIRRGTRSLPGKVDGNWGTWMDEETGQTWYTVERIVEEVGIPKVTLYRWINKGKAKTKEGNKGIIGVDRQEVEESWNYRKERKAFAKALAKHQGINQDSARRWIRRHEISGLSLKEIIDEAKRRILKKGPRLGPGRWWRVTDT